MRNGVDLLESYDGDICIIHGDLADTSANTDQTYYQLVRFCLNTQPRECPIYPDMGINFEPFIGKPNTAQVGSQIAKLITDSVSRQTVLYSNEINVTPFPISKESVAFKIVVGNGSEADNMVVVYDNRDKFVDTYKSMIPGADRVVRRTMPPTINRLK